MSRLTDRIKERIDVLATLTKSGRPFVIVHTGCHDGNLARQMIKRAAKRGRSSVVYWGFDWFDDLTEAVEKAEFGYGRKAVARVEVHNLVVRDKLASKVHIVRGDTRETLPAHLDKIGPADLVLVGGGESPLTVQSDIEHGLKALADHGELVVLNCLQGVPGKGAGDYVFTELASRRSLTIEADVDPARDEHDRTVQLVIVRRSGLPDEVVSVEEVPPTPAEMEKAATPPTLTNPDEAEVHSPDAAFPGETRLTPYETEGQEGAAVGEETPAEDTRPVSETAPGAGPEEAGPAVEAAASAGPTDGQADESAGVDRVVDPAADGAAGGGDRHPDVPAAEVRADRGEVGAAVDAEQPGDPGGRREPGLEAEPLVELPREPSADPALEEERPQPDPLLELGAGGGAAAQDPVHGGGELGREVPAPVVRGGPGGAGRGNRRSRRAANQRPGSSGEAAG